MCCNHEYGTVTAPSFVTASVIVNAELPAVSEISRSIVNGYRVSDAVNSTATSASVSFVISVSHEIKLDSPWSASGAPVAVVGPPAAGRTVCQPPG
jgi:hypothetical protein